MATTIRSRRAASRSRKDALVQKPRGQLGQRVQSVGPEHFGVVSIDGAKKRSKFMLADFYGRVLLPPAFLPHSRGDFQAAIDRIRQAMAEHDLRDLVVAIETTGRYHQPVKRAFRDAGFECRCVHPFASHQFRQPADPGNKTDDTDLAGIHRATINGFGLSEQPLPLDYQRLQLLSRHRRDLVHKESALCCQIREHLHAAMPGYAELFDDLWSSAVALTVARHTGSAEAVRQLGAEGMNRLIRQSGRRCQRPTLNRIVAWAETAAAGDPLSDCLRDLASHLDDDRQRKTQEIKALERTIAGLLVQLPYVLLLVIPGINVVSAADLAGELGPPTHYANANAITGRAGLVPCRYQSDELDLARGRLRRCGNRRLRAALMQIADNLVACNHYFSARADLWKRAGKDPRWIRVKVAKSASRLTFAMVVGRCLFPHPCRQQNHYLLDKLLAFHAEHDTPMSQTLQDVQAAIDQLPRSAYAAEATPLAERLQQLGARRRGPQAIGDILPIVLARLGVQQVQSTASGARDPG
jgi:transposase